MDNFFGGGRRDADQPASPGSADPQYPSQRSGDTQRLDSCNNLAARLCRGMARIGFLALLVAAIFTLVSASCESIEEPTSLESNQSP